MARIDRLPEATRRVLHTAAVLGRTGAYWLLQALWDGPEDLQTQVRELQRLEFLYEQVATAEPGYVFKHALIRDVAYECLPRRTRQTLHAAAGHCLETRYAEDIERVVDLLAYYYARSVEAQKAVTFLTLCAEKAVRTHAHAEAATAFEEALGQVTHLPETERKRRYLELALRQAFSWAFLGRFRETLERLLPQHMVLERLADPGLAGPYYFRLALTYWMLGEHEHAVQSAQRARAEAHCGHDVATLGKASYVLTLVAHASGQFRQAIADGQQAVTLLEQTEKWHYLGLMHWILGSTYGLLGDFTPALEALARVTTLGAATDDPRLQRLAAWTTGWILVLRGEWDTGMAGLQRGFDLATDPASKAFAANYLGFAYLDSGQAAHAIPLLQQAIEHFQRFRYLQGQGRAIAWLGAAWLLSGDFTMARTCAQQGLALSHEARDVYGIGLAQRALGRIAHASGALAEAEYDYLDALKTFATLSAQYELGRTHLALAALAYTQGKRATTRACLRDAAQRFRDLQLPTWLEQTQTLPHQWGLTL
jgi:tetratricopeptide (TPR) repeat protein